MKNYIHSRLLQNGIACSILLLATMSHAATTLVSPSKYAVTEGVAFGLDNFNSENFLFSWTDPTGLPALSFSRISDPTLVLTLGQTYTFQRTSGFHPFAIMGKAAADFIMGSDGGYRRTSFDSATIDAAILTDKANFTADPGPTEDRITWTPALIGDFWYTCTVAGHPSMTGKITVVPEPSGFALIAGGLIVGVLQRRRGSRLI